MKHLVEFEKFTDKDVMIFKNKPMQFMEKIADKMGKPVMHLLNNSIRAAFERESNKALTKKYKPFFEPLIKEYDKYGNTEPIEHFYVIKTKDANAMIAGNTVIIYSGLIDAVKNKDQLKFVLAHEVAHNILSTSKKTGGLFLMALVSMIGVAALYQAFKLAYKKSVDAVTMEKAFTAAVASLITLPIMHRIFSRYYGRRHEYRADELAIKILHRVYGKNFDYEQIIKFFKYLYDEDYEIGKYNIFGRMYSTHPNISDRVDHIINTFKSLGIPTTKMNTELE